MKPVRIGLFGGSFDPPHIGHQALVHAALDVLNLDAVQVIPVGVPVHRVLSGQSTAKQRFDWLQRMFADEASGDRIEVVDWETASREATPSIVTLHRFVRQNPQARPILLLGADAFAHIDTWVDYPQHARLCDVAVFARVGSELSAEATAFQSVSVTEWKAMARSNAKSGYCVVVQVALPDVSATALRERAQSGEDLTGLVPACIRSEVEQAYAFGDKQTDA
ncbi:MAG: nicotinate (nicotinamide) nucleotide adenylyltransferase [Mariprofundaceae bacterium]|nr:nicotinate (nicotinamide) nucleotide adenylyltransferase [Mariprofundaceae bacterium]